MVYIDDLIMTCNKLQKLGDPITDGTKQCLFLEHLSNPKYHSVKYMINVSVAKDDNASFESAFGLIWAHSMLIVWEGNLALQAVNQRTLLATSLSYTSRKPTGENDRKRWERFYLPIMPKWLLNAIALDVRKNVLAWMNIANKEDYEMKQYNAAPMI